MSLSVCSKHVSSLSSPEYSWPTHCSRPPRRQTREKVQKIHHKSWGQRDGWIRRESLRLQLRKSKRVLLKILLFRFSAQLNYFLRHKKIKETGSWHLPAFGWYSMQWDVNWSKTCGIFLWGTKTQPKLLFFWYSTFMCIFSSKHFFFFSWSKQPCQRLYSHQLTKHLGPWPQTVIFWMTGERGKVQAEGVTLLLMYQWL